MAITYTIDEGKKLIFETWMGEIHAEELSAYWKRYLADPDVMKIRRTIVDLRGAAIRFTGKEFDSLIRRVVEPALGGLGWMTAIVAGDPVQYGVSRQYQVFAERYSKDCIFETVADAEKWIGS